MEGLALADVIKIAAGSGVIAALINSGVGWLKEGRQKKAQLLFEAQIDAIHLISKMDALAVECANNYWTFHTAWDQARGSLRQGDVPGCSKPVLIVEPSSISKIDRAVACQIAWLENDIRLGNDEIRSRWEAYLDTDDAVEADADLVGYFGYQALMISRALRAKYSLMSQSAKWGMPRIESQLLECSERAKKFFKEDD